MHDIICSGGTPEQEWYDPSEPRYCICNQVSYGDMVACDNEDVSTFGFALSFITNISKKIASCSRSNIINRHYLTTVSI